MEQQVLIQMALDAGFLHAKVTDRENLVFNPELRRYCEENSCGNFGVNYACPPDCGTPAEMEARVQKYRKALVLQTIRPVESVMDPVQTKEARRIHNQMSRVLVEQLQKAGVEGLPVMAGPCSLCSICAKASGEPCRIPEKIASCLSAYCIDAYRMAQACGLEYWCGEKRVAFFSIYFFN